MQRPVSSVHIKIPAMQLRQTIWPSTLRSHLADSPVAEGVTPAGGALPEPRPGPCSQHGGCLGRLGAGSGQKGAQQC